MAIAVMLAEMPHLLRDVLATSLADEAAIHIVDTEVDEMPLDARLDAVRPDVLVLGLSGEEALHACATALGRFPAIKVFALEELGRHVSLYELRPTRTALGTLSPAELADAIRRAVRPMPIAPHVHVVIGRVPGKRGG